MVHLPNSWQNNIRDIQLSCPVYSFLSFPRKRESRLVPAQAGNQKHVPAQAGIRKMLFSRSLCLQRQVAGSGNPVQIDTYEITFRYLWIPASAGMTFLKKASIFSTNWEMNQRY